MSMEAPPAARTRSVVFISKATPGDDEFVLWLAPRLEAAGYAVFADVLRLELGSRWRQEIDALSARLLRRGGDRRKTQRQAASCLQARGLKGGSR